jgi:hypothetical protein
MRTAALRTFGRRFLLALAACDLSDGRSDQPAPKAARRIRHPCLRAAGLHRKPVERYSPDASRVGSLVGSIRVKFGAKTLKNSPNRLSVPLLPDPGIGVARAGEHAGLDYGGKLIAHSSGRTILPGGIFPSARGILPG